ncbi:PAS domain S-box protein [Methylobacter sp. G7]|uniref:PAS domain S-box protein n=1 Tax=Methylobacter sp. G7 TaxID=3230117 RepID=UPI003D801E9A
MHRRLEKKIDRLLDSIALLRYGAVINYLIALVLVLVAFLVRLAIAPVEAGLPFLAFFPAVTLAVVFGGIGPGLFSLIISSILLSYLFIPPYKSFAWLVNFEVIWSNAVFFSAGMLVILVIDALYRQRKNYINSAKQVDEMQEAQQALRIAAIAFETREGIIITDSNNTIIRTNRAVTDIYGYSPEEMVGQNPSMLTAGRHDRTFYQAMWQSLLRDKQWSGEIWDKRKNGEVFLVWLVISVVTDAAGDVTHYVSTFSDITEYKRSSDELQMHREHLQELVDVQTINLRNHVARTQAILDNVVDGIITINTHGIIETFNKAAERIFDYTAAEVVERHICRLMPEPYYDQCNDDIDNDLVSEHFNEGRRKDGSLFPVEMTMSNIQSGIGAFFIVFVRDISERSQYELALISAKNEAERANQAKSDFLSAMSHEIRTPMNGVIGMVDVLHQTSLNGYQVEMVNIIRNSAFSLLAVIEDILDFSKIEAGKLKIEWVPAKLEEITESVCLMLQHLAEKKKVELMLFIDPRIPAVVSADAHRLRQILINLVSNAIKFSSGQEGMGLVSVQVLLVEPTALEIRVIDNGIGMDEKSQAQLFTPFTQAESSTTRRFGGTGLGLSIAYNLVQLMGGEIAVQSILGQGSTFTVRLPLVTVQEQADVSAAQALVTGISCLVIGGTGGLADHLVAYLASAGVVVEQTPTLAAAAVRERPAISGPWVWLIDVGNTPRVSDELRAIINVQTSQDVHFVVVGRGRRRSPRWNDTDQVVEVDGNVLTRQTLFQAVAIAAGRMPVDMDAQPSYSDAAAFIAPARIIAQQQGKLILVAEDNETNQQVIQRQLNLLGFAVDIASDGQAALERWRSGDYALVLTDLHMPVMDGYALTRAIRAEENNAHRHTVIIALTASVRKGEDRRCSAGGMDDYLSKPTPLEKLNKTLNKWLPDLQSADATTLSEASMTSAIQGAVLKPLDVSVLEALVGDNPELIRAFLHDFHSSATQIAAVLKSAYEMDQTEQVGAQAHKLKSSARSVGALELGELCAQIERASQAGEIEAMNALVPRFEVEMAAISEYLDMG